MILYYIPLLAAIVVGTSIWAAADAAGRDRSDLEGPFGLSAGWPVVLLACLLLWIVAFPLYLVERQRTPPKQHR